MLNCFCLFVKERFNMKVNRQVLDCVKKVNAKKRKRFINGFVKSNNMHSFTTACGY